jgi:hypothetical protein
MFLPWWFWWWFWWFLVVLDFALFQRLKPRPPGPEQI